MGINDYVVTGVFPTQTIRPVYDIDDAYQVSANYNKEPVISYDSYLVYGGRSLDALTPVYTTANFQTELTDYESMDQDENGTITNYEDYTFYGYEFITANVGNDGLNYLIVSNPMKIETIDVDMANTLDFSQIDTIAQDYINKHTFDETVYDITDIRYGLIRVSNEEDDSYQLPRHGIILQKEARKANPIISHLPTSLSTPSTEASTITNLATSINIETNQINRRTIL